VYKVSFTSTLKQCKTIERRNKYKRVVTSLSFLFSKFLLNIYFFWIELYHLEKKNQYKLSKKKRNSFLQLAPFN